jgi:competence protein ComGC
MKNLIKECSDVLTLNITTLAISFTQVEMLLKIVLLILSIIYTIDKLIKNRKKNG